MFNETREVLPTCRRSCLLVHLLCEGAHVNDYTQTLLPTIEEPSKKPRPLEPSSDSDGGVLLRRGLGGYCSFKSQTGGVNVVHSI
jgi:hypothetical protein